ncbi:unnamed protein product [Prorocentrum cordatum]|uniref:Glucose-methanol-choline oxidoreductase N-terminal domain-containing protein n=1 Tax=Prorocentrum cordatum TaxID=2364126 RepID=A0ABN9W616_9DINO|nr:unnamed protein product [Polarella glacialis]
MRAALALFALLLPRAGAGPRESGTCPAEGCDEAEEAGLVQHRARGRARGAARGAAALPAAGAAEGEFDVVVVGAGLSGSAVLGRLAELLPADFRILALEAGRASHFALGGRAAPGSAGADGQWQEWAPRLENVTRYDVPGNYPVLGGQSEDHWQDVPGTACKVLGGCGVMNGALMQVPTPGCFAAWPPGWQWEDVEPSFAAVFRRRDSST